MDFVDKESNQVDSMAIYNIKQWSILNSLQFQNKIEVTDLLRTCNIGKDDFCGPSGHLLNFDLLLGSPSELERRSINYEHEIMKIDRIIEEEMQFEEALLTSGVKG